MDRPLRIGTRGSPLALAQTRLVAERLAARRPGLPPPVVTVVKTTGDAVQDRPLAEIGGKGLFAKEIEAALLAGAIDCGVHSLKDMETRLPDGLAIAAVLPRADPRDALIAPAARSLAALPRSGRVATGSVRRAAQLLAARPDLVLAPLRGNVETRLAKIRAGAADATFLAMAGLARLGLVVPEATALDPDDMLPAACQGLVAVECRAGDARVRDLLAAIDDEAGSAMAATERATLAGLDGSCRTPIAAYAELGAGGGLRLRALVATPDGSALHRAERSGQLADGPLLGADLAAELRARAPASLFAA